ncbi:uncharacterized protein LOC111704679 [Eurytemora carolleeae]|uniref:uncharacterized protein LOC111704679 n=1 Tax=Eurytemora carolleeae TaxID=1294199 RepID=UPI000C75BA82|nr:uncharacterized protein LOC111704679 [Eurytemora carolleeae]|eukprot:XP_023332761.1 uncharacterized protein LOC111704679 [Eurytemora affinis]
MINDWQQGPAMPCDGMNRAAEVYHHIKGIEKRLRDFLCKLKLELIDAGVQDADIQAVVEPSLSVQIYRYPSCTSRKMRDCLVMSKLQELFNLPSLLLDIQDIQDTHDHTSHTSASNESG